MTVIEGYEDQCQYSREIGRGTITTLSFSAIPSGPDG